MALLISMLVLLIPQSLAKCPFPRGLLNTLSCAIGNEKPEILIRVEVEIWKTLSVISKDSSSSAVKSALIALIRSEAFCDAVALPSTDPVFSFFEIRISPSQLLSSNVVSSPSSNVADAFQGSITSEVAAAPVNAAWPSYGLASSPQLFWYQGFPSPAPSPGLFNVPGLTYHPSGISGSHPGYHTFAPNSTAPFPFVSLHSPIYTPYTARSPMIPFTPRNAMTPSRILLPMSADAPGLAQSGDTDRDFGKEPQLGPYDDPMGVALDLEDAMAQNEAAAYESELEGGGDDIHLAPGLRHLVDTIVSHPANFIQNETNETNSEGSEYFHVIPGSSSRSTLTSQITRALDNMHRHATTRDKEDQFDDPSRAPQAIRQSSRSKKVNVSKPGKSVALRATQRPRIIVDANPVDEVSVGVLPNPLQSSWKQLEENIFILNPQPTLDNTIMRKILSNDRVVTAWGPRVEDKLEFNFIAHELCEETLTLLESLVDLVTDSYEDGKPPHLVNSGKKSIFMVLTELEFRALGDSEVQDLLRQCHIIVTDMPHDLDNFEGALELLAPLYSPTSIQDQSLHPTTTVIGKVSDILNATEPSQRKILNGLSFPKPFAGVHLSTYSSDAHAFMSVFNQEGWAKNSPIPVADIRWGLAGTEGAFHHWHFDSDGFGTFVEPVAGAKWWIVARPPADDHGFDTFNRTSLFFHEAFDLVKSGKGLFAAEAILLQPGTRLLMRPNTLHAVYTPQHAVCDGGHFYATSTIRDTFVGLVHTFICDRYITNITHVAFRFVLAQMINFHHSALVKNEAPNTKSRAHVPDPMNPSSFMDLLIVCGLGVLINVLSFQTYMVPGADLDGTSEMTALQARYWEEDDVNHMTEHDRKLCCLARGQSLDIISWLSTNFAVKTADTRSPKELFATLLLDMCKMIVLYKDLADSEDVKHKQSFTSNRLRTQIAALLSMPEVACPQDPNPSTWMFPPIYKNSCPMLPSSNESHQLQPIQNVRFALKSIGALCKLGETERDRKFAARMEVKHEHVDDEDKSLPDKKRKRTT